MFESRSLNLGAQTFASVNGAFTPFPAGRSQQSGPFLIATFVLSQKNLNSYVDTAT
jgi:hypothetical protein